MKAALRRTEPRELWTEALLLPGHADLRRSLVGELAEYLGSPEDEVEGRCRTGAELLAAEWRAAGPQGAEEVERFYRTTDAYLYDLTWWHTLTEDESALAAVEALRTAKEHRARTVLDFGAGIGSLGLLLSRWGFDVTLAEINAGLADYARHRFRRRGLSATFIGPDHLPEAAFDFVSAVDVLEHLPEPLPVFERLARALKPGGTLFVHLPPEEDGSRPMHLWHDPEELLRHAAGAGLWLESAAGPSLTLRRGPAPRYRLERGLAVRPTKSGWALVSERPLMATKLNEQAAGILERLGDPRTAAEVSHETGLPLTATTAFLDGLAGKRVLTREARTLPAHWPTVTVAVPARDRPAETRACAESLLALDYPQELLEVIVVDDASRVPLSEVLCDLPVRVIHLEKNVGQSAARNLAAREARGEIVAFLDNDCVAQSDWLRALVAPLCEPGVDLAGGRVLSPSPDGAVAAFEAVRSPLDMGSVGGPVGLDETVPYLPSCNLGIDREILLGLGGFDREMSLGEDADLVWRAISSGSGVRYVPEASVVHRHRTHLSELLRRRADYASSEADLQRRHPASRRRMMVPLLGTMLLALPAALLLAPPVGFGLVLLVAALLVVELVTKWRRLRGAGVRLPLRKVIAAVARQHGAGIYHLGTNVARYYSLPLLALSLLLPPVVIPAAVLLLVPAVVDWRRFRPEASLPEFVFLYCLELSAYQLGVWRGCLERRTLRPLIPKPRLSR
ncbi:mycofactocin system glycosyltransferase [Rubrobacter radiotolerans]|uniref:Mycofactocin biosynthesis glycosyltransferase MftF n=1 Tax=Rubrobacter radiotolerans TaxID=42256 RepID=A0A023X626_RUBRA|nr:mycofactocin biosynthesis glycosyltransferase MftF [Rubrobacter radiotolerans]AHY47922.1 mycofactocin system glycosyltransferase [Rubrobacter radiotolerans]MDX5892561.1 mycofactocin biosynthesis glycosyltransferase MftF [Rubrobacter radiotolerans]SMC07850.1 mycofactocin system glycosyltransferase [Rubrobacter radiotolerans DSM 5868]